MTSPLDEKAMQQLFTEARTINVWSDKPVPNETWHELYELMKFGPTSANCSPARLIFVTSPEAKERLAAHAMEGNDAKIKASAATVIIGHDLNFARKLGELFPHDQTAASWFDDPEVRDTTAFRNGTLQGAYLMLAARALGLDCGPMSGFDNDAVDAEFFAGTSIKSNFICALGYGTREKIFPRSPRLAFDDAATLL